MGTPKPPKFSSGYVLFIRKSRAPITPARMHKARPERLLAPIFPAWFWVSPASLSRAEARAKLSACRCLYRNTSLNFVWLSFVYSTVFWMFRWPR